MKIIDIDYYAQFGKSWLNRVPVWSKLFGVFFVLTAVVLSTNVYFLGCLYLVLLLITLISSVPGFKIIKISLYPLIFLILFLVSIQNLTLQTALMFIFKAVNASTSLVLLVFTTSYTKIFAALSRILPEFMANILFLTYRSIFILAKTMENLVDMLKFRGKPSLGNPALFLSTIGNIVGFFVIKSIQTSENLYDAMKLRGFSDRFTYLKEK